MEPVAAGEVEGRCGDEEEERDGIEKVRHFGRLFASRARSRWNDVWLVADTLVWLLRDRRLLR